MSRKEKAEIVDFVMDVRLKALSQGIECCFGASETCVVDVVPCCHACNKPVREAWEASEMTAEYFCSGCNRFVAVSYAMYCWVCGVCVFPEDMHEQIARLRMPRNGAQKGEPISFKMSGRVLRFRPKKESK